MQAGILKSFSDLKQCVRAETNPNPHSTSSAIAVVVENVDNMIMIHGPQPVIGSAESESADIYLSNTTTQ